MENYKKQDYLRVIRAFGYSVNGLIAAWKNEQAFRQELILGILLGPALYFMQAPLGKKLILLALYCSLLIVELLNSAIEALADAVTMETHPLIRKAKDMASAAVLLTILVNIAAWLFTLTI